MSPGQDRRARLERARLYLVSDAGIPADALDAALAGGVDMLQLRDPALDDAALLEVATSWRAACDAHGALLWVNDRPDLALAADADGVHVGQDDAAVTAVRELVGDDVLIGLSTHAPEQLEAGIEAGADQLSVGPVWETPTKPGRPAAGLDYVRHAAQRRPPVPWFAIGGIDRQNVAQVIAAGGERIVVVRALRDAADHRRRRGRAARGRGGKPSWRSAVAASAASSANAPAQAPTRPLRPRPSAPRAAVTSWPAATHAAAHATRRRGRRSSRWRPASAQARSQRRSWWRWWR